MKFVSSQRRFNAVPDQVMISDSAGGTSGSLVRLVTEPELTRSALCNPAQAETGGFILSRNP